MKIYLQELIDKRTELHREHIMKVIKGDKTAGDLSIQINRLNIEIDKIKSKRSGTTKPNDTTQVEINKLKKEAENTINYLKSIENMSNYDQIRTDIEKINSKLQEDIQKLRNPI